MVKVNGNELLFYRNNQLRVRVAGFNEGEGDVGFVDEFELKPPFSLGYSETGHLVLTAFPGKVNANPRLIYLEKIKSIEAAVTKDLSSILVNPLLSEDGKTTISEALKVISLFGNYGNHLLELKEK